MVKKTRLLKVHKERMRPFMDGFEEYDFKICEYPIEYHRSMESEEFLDHLYNVLELFSRDGSGHSLGKILILYGVFFGI